jgi:hypothetical protein
MIDDGQPATRSLEPPRQREHVAVGQGVEVERDEVVDNGIEPIEHLRGHTQSIAQAFE